MKIFNGILLSLLLVGIEPALALRCGGKLVSEGAMQGKVLKFCGEPTAVQVRSIYRSGFPRTRLYSGTTQSAQLLHDRELLIADRSYVEVLVEEWTYNFGPHRLMRLIHFENGVVTAILQLGYGYRD